MSLALHPQHCAGRGARTEIPVLLGVPRAEGQDGQCDLSFRGLWPWAPMGCHGRVLGPRDQCSWSGRARKGLKEDGWAQGKGQEGEAKG